MLITSHRKQSFYVCNVYMYVCMYVCTCVCMYAYIDWYITFRTIKTYYHFSLMECIYYFGAHWDEYLK